MGRQEWELVGRQAPNLPALDASPRGQSSHTWALCPHRVCPVLSPLHLWSPGGQEPGLPALWMMLLVGAQQAFPRHRTLTRKKGPSVLSSTAGWDACSPLFSPSWPGRAVLAMAGSEKGKKCAPSPCRTSCPTRCPGATAQPGGHCIPSPVRAETITARCRGPATEAETPGFNCSPDHHSAALGYSMSKAETRLPCGADILEG